MMFTGTTYWYTHEATDYCVRHAEFEASECSMSVTQEVNT